ncbi:MAG: 4Fe-4S dicluster domain-containing protein [Clostridiales bacterium]|nr:4Fe-4S dicluster domain-containing protein [Clostridiales bacterium]
MQVHEPGDRPEPKFKPAKTVRTFNMNKCTHPTCTKCIEICPINSISFTDGRMTIKDSCINCALCDKMCPELAIEIDAESRAQRTNHVIDMKKCNYPECTLCADYCPMQSIAFSSGTPVFSKNCEGCDLCWTICPKAAISITNLETTHKPMTMELPLSEHPGHPFLKILEAAEKKGKFRRLVPLEQVGTNGIVWQNPNAPRFTIEHEEP